MEELFGDHTLAITLSKVTVTKPAHGLRRTVAKIRPSLPPINTPTMQPRPKWLNQNTDDQIKHIINHPLGYDIFTDGHWKLKGSGILDAVHSLRPW